MTFRPGLAGLAAGLLVVGEIAAVGPSAAQPPAAPPPAAPPAAAAASDHAASDHAAQPRRTEAEPTRTSTRARRLIRATRRHAPRWRDVADARAAGYRTIGDAVTGYEHFVHPVWAADEEILDPRRPESLVYRVDGEGRRLVSVMYVLPPGSTRSDVPDLGDDRARWHRHDDLCWDERGRVVGLHRGGRCIPGGTHVVTPPMLHVWLVEHPCGPFAGLEGHGDRCAHEPSAHTP